MRTDSVTKIQSSLKWLAVLACLSFLLLNSINALSGAPTQQQALTPQEQRGKQIYLRGTSASGREILAYLGESSLEVPASALACANCHGLDGQGKPEGGVTPSNLNWELMTKPYGVTHASGRKHPPYTERALDLAITRGLDPAGNKLLNVMPRYQMSRDDMADLIAYLKLLGTEHDPGVSENSIKLGVVLPTKGALAELGEDIKAALTAYFNEINAQGGLYNRRIELKFTETGETATATRENVLRLLQDEQVFALVGSFAAGAEKEFFTLLAEREVPLVGPLTLYPQTGFPLNRQVFYLLPGMSEQACALVKFAAQKLPDKSTNVAILYPATDLARSVVEAIKDQCKKDGWGVPENHEYQPGSFDAAAEAAQLSKAGRRAVFFLGSGGDALALMREADKLHWTPNLYLPGAGLGAEGMNAPAGFSNKIFLSFPTSPADQTPQGVNEFRALATKYKLPARHVAAQLSVYAAAEILVEGLKRAGKDLSREKLIASLEGLYEFETGLTPAISYGPNRRIGALGAYIVSIDLEKKEFVPVSAWVKIN